MTMKSASNLQNFTEVRLELDPNKILFAPNLEGVIEYEVWKDIPNYEGYYEVSSFGRVKSLEKAINSLKSKNGYRIKKTIILKYFLDKKGYFNCCLYKNKCSKNFSIHQLIAITFLGHTPNGFEVVVDHISSIKTNNFLWNIQLLTNRENVSKGMDGGSSNYTGVHWHKNGEKWHSRIQINGKRIHLGSFENEYDAHLAYQEKLKTV